MKKLFTLVALLAMVLGANAKWSENPIYTIDYSTYSGFPFYVMGYVPEFDNGYMTDFGANYKYAEVKPDAEETSDVIVTTQGGAQYYRWTEGGGWHQYFIADGIPTTIDHKYKVVAKVKASSTVSINVNMGWGWGSGEQVGTSVSIPGDAEFQEVEWEYEGIGGASCNLVAQPGGSTETIEWLSLEVYDWIKEGGREPVWLEDIENGDAETPWTDEQKAIAYNDNDNNYTICAWSKEKGVNMDEEGKAWNPFPATIVEDPTNPENHVFLCDGQPATTEGDASAWDNQFWIQSKHSWKSGLTMKIKFRYMASQDVSSTDTQIHNQTPSDYLIWHAIGNIHFTEEWQTFDNTMSIADDMAGGWSIAFNLNSVVKDAVKFYFDDLSWQYLQLDEGYFLAGVNVNVSKDYDDLDNAIQFEDVDGTLEATIGTKGDAATYVDQLMISTVRGDDAAFKGATLLPQGKIHNDPEEWLDYAPSANKKLDVPGLGVWKVYLDTEYEAMAFEMLEGTPYEEADPVEVYTYADELVLHAVERDWLTPDGEGNPREAEVGTGQPWDSQFWIAADRDLKTDEVTVLKFQYKGSIAAHTTTQVHKVGDDGKPCTYLNWQAIGDVDFTEEWQDFETEFKVPSGDDGMRSIVFNMAEIKAACDYSIKNVQWYLKDASLDEGLTYENLISGASNFYFKESAETAPYTGIENVTVKNVKTSNAIYNIAGQRVNKDYKGLVIKDGKKVVK